MMILFISAELASIISSRSKRSLDDQNSTESVSNNTEIVYYIRLRALDRKNNSAPWSNIVSASFLKPEEFSKPVSVYIHFLITSATVTIKKSMCITII